MSNVTPFYRQRTEFIAAAASNDAATQYLTKRYSWDVVKLATDLPNRAVRPRYSHALFSLARADRQNSPAYVEQLRRDAARSRCSVLFLDAITLPTRVLLGTSSRLPAAPAQDVGQAAPVLPTHYRLPEQKGLLGVAATWVSCSIYGLGWMLGAATYLPVVAAMWVAGRAGSVDAAYRAAERGWHHVAQAPQRQADWLAWQHSRFLARVANVRPPVTAPLIERIPRDLQGAAAAR